MDRATDSADILKFIYAKQNLTILTNFNISVKVPDAFMKNLAENPDAPHVVVNPRTKRRYVIPRSVDINSYSVNDLVPAAQAKDSCYTVKEIWDMLIKNAHATGEPGVCFIDRTNEGNPTPNLGRIEASNPCGEQYLLAYESCNLGSINVSKFARKDRTDLDWRSLAKTVKLAVRFLDGVIDANHWPIAQIGKITLGNRKIGLGVMGFYDALVLLGIRYDSRQAVEFATELARFIQERAHKASEQLAKERGTFPNWPGSIWDTELHRPMRNAAFTTIAPTGSISIIAGCSSGIEPIFSLVYQRKIEGENAQVVHPVFERLAKEHGFYRPEFIKEILRQGSLKKVRGIPDEIKHVFVTALEIAPQWHVRVQAVFQKHTDNAVSKTVNLPQTSNVQDVKEVFLMARHLGCKGVTVYRDGSNPEQVLQTKMKVPDKNNGRNGR